MRLKMKHIRNRITISVSVVVVCVILVITMIISYIYSNELMRRMAIITDQKMDIIVKNLEEELGKVIELQNSIQDDESLQRLIIEVSKENRNDQYLEREISEALRQYAYENINVNSIFAFDMNLDILDPLYKIEPYKEIVEEFTWFYDLVQSNRLSGFSEPTSFPNRQYHNTSETKATITYFSTYINTNNFVQIGYLLLNIKKDNIFRKFTQACQEEFDFVILVDEKANIIHSVGNSHLDNQEVKAFMTKRHEGVHDITVENLSTYIITRPVENYKDWVVIGGISYGTMNRESEMISKIVFLLTGFSLLLVILISFIISRKITEPIIEVTHAMEVLEKGRWPEPLRAKSEDELKTLVEGFNKMIVDVQVLFLQVKQEQNEKHEYEVNNLKLRLDILQSQINPHFIHNTLNGLKYLAVEEKAYRLVDLIESFNLLLRSSMSINRDFISIAEELECVRSFLNIFEIRYDYSIKIKLSVEAGVEAVKIPKLILQPIVENSVYHGIMNKDEEGFIEIRINKTDHDSILIEVEDNGIGMSKDKIFELLNQKDEENKQVAFSGKKGFNNIGLKNIKDRLNLYYDQASRLMIHSQEGMGTVVSFEIPLIGIGDDTHGDV